MQALASAKANVHIVADGIIIGPHLGQVNDLAAFDFDATDCPDLFPPLVALAAVCKGVTEIKGVSRLEHKESDRGLTLQTEFAKLGIQINLEGDTMKIMGGSAIQAATVFSQHDHRIAMACGVAALCANGPVEITEAEAINKSYTDFFKDIQQLGAKVDIQ
jgi:3-phosphoshikimate 1-carboxyvinyltransferase